MSDRFREMDFESLATYLRRAEILLELAETDPGVSERVREIASELARMRATWPLVEYRLPYVVDAKKVSEDYPAGVVDQTGVVQMPVPLQPKESRMFYAIFPSDKPFLLREISAEGAGKVIVELFEGTSYKSSASNEGCVRDAWLKYPPRKPIRFGLRADDGLCVVEHVVVSGYVLGT